MSLIVTCLHRGGATAASHDQMSKDVLNKRIRVMLFLIMNTININPLLDTDIRATSS